MTGSGRHPRSACAQAAPAAWRERILEHCLAPRPPAREHDSATESEAPGAALSTRGARLQRDMVRRRLSRLIADALPTARGLMGETHLDALAADWIDETRCPVRQFWRVPTHFAAWLIDGTHHLGATDRDAIRLDAAAWALRDAPDPGPLTDHGSDLTARLVFAAPSTFVSVAPAVAERAGYVGGSGAGALGVDADDSDVHILLSRRTNGVVRGHVVPAWWRNRLEHASAATGPFPRVMDEVWSTLSSADARRERDEFVARLAPLLRAGVVTFVPDDGGPPAGHVPRLWRASELVGLRSTIQDRHCNESSAAKTV